MKMKLTEEQIKFLDKVCVGRWLLTPDGKIDNRNHVNMNDMNLTEIPVKFGRVDGQFFCNNNKLTTLKNCPDEVGWSYYISIRNNKLTEYFKTIKEEELIGIFDKLEWVEILHEYPFLINKVKPIMDRRKIKAFLNLYPHLKLYLE